MNVIYPLAVPKGRRLCCEVCEAPAERMCTACTVTYYCGPVHQKADWASIHEKICQLLIPLRTTMPFYNSEEERQHGLQQLQKRQKHLIEFCYTVAQKYLFEGRHEDAVPAALHSLRFRMNMHGLSSVELVPAYLLLAEASLGLGRIVQAEEYLSQARWTVLKSTNCSNATHSLLHRNLGLLYMAKENHEEARYHLANDVSEHLKARMLPRTVLLSVSLPKHLSNSPAHTDHFGSNGQNSVLTTPVQTFLLPGYAKTHLPQVSVVCG